MSGFERADMGDAWTTDTASPFPDDFSSEEADFASELRTLFTPEREELPPYFVETLLSDERHAVAEPAFEHKLAYRVLRRLRLPRGPLYARGALWRAGMRDALRHLSRPAAAAAAAALVLMALTMVVVSPSFASGLSILLGHTGVRQVSSYPTNVRASTHPSGASAAQLSQQGPQFAPTWLGKRAGKYDYAGLSLVYTDDWSNGPVVDVQYVMPGQGTGSGVLDIREFQVASQLAAVLQVVQMGSASLVNVGATPAVYVDGGWSALAGHEMRDASDPASSSYGWQSGIRSELIFERGNVVYWIVGDQRDGAGQDELIHLASQLVPIDESLVHPRHVSVSVLAADASFDASFRSLQGKEVYDEVPRGGNVDSGVGAFVSSQDS